MKRSQFESVVLCDDVRDEVGNKKSLMGAFSGDIVVAELPALINLALYFVYHPNKKNSNQKMKIALRQDDKQIAEITAEIDAKKDITAIVVPRAFIRFEKECSYSAIVTVDNEEPVEIMRKKLILGKVQPR